MRWLLAAVGGLVGLWLLGQAGNGGGVASVAAQGQPASRRLYTLDADFDLGVLVNVNHTAPHNHQLQLNRTTSLQPFVNIAASGRGTVLRIHAVTGSIVGEYWTAPDGMGRDPSRTTVDRLGNVWVTNRAESSGGLGSVTRIGVVIGGTRVSANGRPDIFGEYLKPPFQYNTCVDRNGDGLIRTSRTQGDIHFWTNAGGVDSAGGVETAYDECIINFTRVGGINARTVAVDARNDIWVGGANTVHEKLSGATGQPVPGTRFNLRCGGYGGLIDPQGVLWSARYGAGLLRFETGTGTGGCLGNATGNYGLGLDPTTGHIWQSSVGGDRRLYELDSSGRPVNSYLQPFDGQGVVVDANSHVWMAEILGTRVWHLAPDPQAPGRHIPVGLVEGLGGVTGVAVDLNGRIWAPEINANRVSRIDPRLGGRGGGGYTIGAVDFAIDLGEGARPYNYSDMTGFVSLGATAPQGTWTVVYDTGVDDTRWGRITWNTEPQGVEPPGASIQVEARAAATQAGLAGQTFIPVTNGLLFGLTGRYIEVRATLRPSLSGESPVLSDLAIEAAPPTVTPTATASATPTATSSATATASPTRTATPTATPLPLTPSPSPTRGEGSMTPTGTPSVTDTPTRPPTKTATPTVTPPPRLYDLYLPLLRQFSVIEP